MFGIGEEASTLYITGLGPKPTDPDAKRRYALYRVPAQYARLPRLPAGKVGRAESRRSRLRHLVALASCQCFLNRQLASALARSQCHAASATPRRTTPVPVFSTRVASLPPVDAHQPDLAASPSRPRGLRARLDRQRVSTGFRQRHSPIGRRRTSGSRRSRPPWPRGFARQS